MKKFICTAGTSIAQGVPDSCKREAGEPLRGAIRARLAKLAEQYQGAEFLKRASAESNSISRLTGSPDDAVVLLHSETPDGKICAEEVERLVAQHLRIATECKQVDGIQATDDLRFRRVGVQNLFAELGRHCGNSQYASDGGVVINVTGGYKSTVPYAALYGLLHQIPVVYIFEQSEALFTLPYAPVHFDYDRLAPAADAIATLYQRTSMSREEFFNSIAGLAYHDRRRYEPLLEEAGAEVTLSAFGLLFHESLQRDAGKVLLSPAGAKTYQSASGDAREQFDFMLDRVRNPMIRRAKWHPFHGTDLHVYKPGNTAHRMAYYLRGDDVYVCELYGAHDERYEKMLAGKRIADYAQDGFTPWLRPVDSPAESLTDEDWATKQEQKLSAVRQTCAALEQLLADAEESRKQSLAHDAERSARMLSWEQEASQSKLEANELRRRLEEIETRYAERNLNLASVSERADRLQCDADTLRQESASLRARLAQPWYARLLAKIRKPR